MKKIAGIISLVVVLAGCSSSRLIQSELGSGWANNSVNTVIFRQKALTTHEGIQFTAYYDEDSFLILGKRALPSGGWEIQKTPYQGNTKDAHNAISIAVDAEGYLHVSWDHHDTRLRYAVSEEPFGLNLGAEQEMTGKNENTVSYPQFYNVGDRLLFMYRSGQSGRGSLVVNSYDVQTEEWSPLHQNLLDGQDQRNAYWQAYVDRQDVIHLSWVWRESWDVSTNHDIGYARSADGGKTWQRSTGENYELPITAETTEYAWKVPQNSSLINQTSMTTDKQGRPYIASYWNEENTTQFQVVYLEDGEWKNTSTDFRTSFFQLGGGGTKRIPISRPEILVRTTGEKKMVYLLFRDEDRGNKVSLAFKDLAGEDTWKVQDLTEESVGQWEPNYDKELFRQNERLHIFVQKVTQIDGEGVAQEPSTPVKVLEVNELPE